MSSMSGSHRPTCRHTLYAALLAFTGVAAAAAGAGDSSDADIARQLNNPVADLISVPFQFNYDQDIGPRDQGERYLLNIQPVIPIKLNEEWNVISRTILPLIQLDDVPPGNDESGQGDILQSLFFSPRAPTARGWIWGVGPALSMDTASDDLGTGKWSAGPTMVALRQVSGWTYGLLTNQLWSFAGDGDRKDVDATYLQPFLVYTTSTHTSYSLNTESTYNWEGNDWSVPINLAVSQVFRIGRQPMSLQLGVRYWAQSPDGGAEGWGARLTYTLVFPTGS